MESLAVFRYPPTKQPCPLLKFLRIFSLVYLTSLAIFAHAQQPDAVLKAAQENEKRLQEEALRQKYEQEQNSQKNNVFLQSNGDNKQVEATDSTTCFEIHEIKLSGISGVLDSKSVTSVTDLYKNKCLNLNTIDQLIKALTNLYIESGYITSRVFIEPQNLSGGTLELRVIEGKLEKIESSNNDLSETQLRLAFPVEKNQILNLRDIEQGLEQLNRLQQNHSEMELQPGNELGTSVALIKNSKTSPYHSSLGLNNSGSEATGKNLATASLSWDNPLSINDNMLFSFNKPIRSAPGAESKSSSFSYSLANGYANYGYTASYFSYAQLVKGQLTNYISSGSSLNQSLTADYVISRGQKSKISLNSSISRKENKNYLENVFLETSSKMLYLTDLGINYTLQINRGLFTGEVKWTKSVDWFGAKTKLSSAERDYQFDKYEIDLNLNREIDILNSPINYQASVNIFYTPAAILTSEAFSLGGRYSVRGIEGEGITGYKGAYFRNEFSKNFTALKGRWSPYIGIDTGISDTPDYADKGNEYLSGAVLGLRFSAQSFFADVTYTQALRMPKYLTGDRSGIYASLRFNY